MFIYFWDKIQISCVDFIPTLIFIYFWDKIQISCMDIRKKLRSCLKVFPKAKNYA